MTIRMLVCCNRCDEQVALNAADEDEARWKAASVGWITEQDDQQVFDMCPACVKRSELQSLEVKAGFLMPEILVPPETIIPDEVFQLWRKGASMCSLSTKMNMSVSVLGPHFWRKVQQIGREKALLSLAESGSLIGRRAVERAVDEPRLTSKEVLNDLVLEKLAEKIGTASQICYWLTEAGWEAVRELKGI